MLTFGRVSAGGGEAREFGPQSSKTRLNEEIGTWRRLGIDHLALLAQCTQLHDRYCA